MLNTVKKIIELFKVRISLTITLCAVSGVFIMPHSNSFSLNQFIILIVCTFLSSASSSAFNQYYEKDLDILMPRTSQRPFATGFFKSDSYWLFIFFTLLVISLSVAALYLNIATAIYLLLGAIFYGYVYTIVLKRSSIYNIVIGGLAGSFAVLAGSAAVNPMLSVPAIILSLILFLWTPPHFWSLAIAIEEDYAKAKIPMLPNLIGAKSSSYVILSQTILLVIISFVPLLFNMGFIYLSFVLIGSLYFLWKSIILVFETTKKNAMSNFFASFIQLGLLLFACIIEGLINYI
ncbi:MAG: heme o synthase [Pseudomonadota bacterium]|nr:heme o synthase [Pseudomonadota bacterium]